MKKQITCFVQIDGQLENPCKNYENLTVKIFQVTLSAEKLLMEFEPDKNGMFIGELETEKSTTIIARLYLKESSGRAQGKHIDESGPHSPKGEIVNIHFKYDPSKFSKPLYTLAKSAVTANLGKIKLKDLNSEQQKQLRCIACIGERTLERLINANRLLSDVQLNMRNCIQKMERAMKQESKDSAYLKKALSNIQLLSNEETTESILFALIKNDNSLELHQVLTISRLQLQKKIKDAVDDNTIAAINNADKIIDGFIALRNCVLFNSNYDNYFYDAKLIHLASFDLKTKDSLLDRTIEAGSLAGFLGEENN